MSQDQVTVLVTGRNGDRLVLLNGGIYWEANGVGGFNGRYPFSELNKLPGRTPQVIFSILYLVVAAVKAFYAVAADRCGGQRVNALLAAIVRAQTTFNFTQAWNLSSILLQCIVNGLDIVPGSLVFVRSTTYRFVTRSGADTPIPNSTPAGFGASHGVVALDAPTGGYLVGSSAGAPNNITQVFDSQFRELARITSQTRATCSNYRDTFYTWESITDVVRRISRAGSVTQTWTISKPGGGQGARYIAVSPDGTTAYVGFALGTTVYRCDLTSGSTPTPTPFLTHAGHMLWSCNPSIITFRNGNILVSWEDEWTTNTVAILYGPNGLAIRTFAVPGAEQAYTLCVGLDDTTFWRIRSLDPTITIEELNVSTGNLERGFRKTESVFQNQMAVIQVPINS